MKILHPEASYGLDCSVELGDLTPLEHDILSNVVPELGNCLIIARLSGKSAELTGLKGLNRRLHLFGMRIKSLPSFESYCKQFYLSKKSKNLDLVLRSKELMALKICHEFYNTIHSGISGTRPEPNFFDSKKETIIDAKLLELNCKNSVSDSKLIKLIQNSESLLRLRLELNSIYSAKNHELKASLAESLRSEILSVNWGLALEEPEFNTQNIELALEKKIKLELLNKKSIIDFKKSAIKKTCKLFNLCGQESALRVFISENSLEVSDPNSSLMVELIKNKSLLSDSVSAHKELDFVLYDISNGVKTKIADYCVYLRNAPTLDQVLGFKLLIDSGDLQDILEKGNAYNVNIPFISKNRDRLTLPDKLFALSDRLSNSSKLSNIEFGQQILKGNYGIYKKDIELKLVSASYVKPELKEAFEFLKSLLSLDDSYNKKLFLGYLGLSRLDPIDEQSLTFID